MDRRLSNGLAWAGALLVIGIPVADYVTGTFAGAGPTNVAVVNAPVEEASAAAPVAVPAKAEVAAKPAEAAPVPQKRPEPEPEPAEVAAAPPAEPVKTATATSADPVENFIRSGKPLPSYITDGAPAAQPAATEAEAETETVETRTETAAVSPATAPATTQATPEPTEPAEQVANLQPAKVPPLPMPLSMRPRPVAVPLASQGPLIVNGPSQPVPAPEPGIITAEDLEDWESGPLSEFLARRGQQSSATYEVHRNAPAPAPEDGFWLDEVPSDERPFRRFPQSDERVYYLPF